MNELGNLRYAPGSRRYPYRKGRGPGSGNGKTAGRGTKGLKSRSGGKMAVWHEGGQMPLLRRVPKRGFTNVFKKEFVVLSTDQLTRFSPDEPVTVSRLRSAGLIKGKKERPVKLVAGRKPLEGAYVVALHAFTEGARRIIESAGGRVEVVQC